MKVRKSQVVEVTIKVTIKESHYKRKSLCLTKRVQAQRVQNALPKATKEMKESEEVVVVMEAMGPYKNEDVQLMARSVLDVAEQIILNRCAEA